LGWENKIIGGEQNGKEEKSDKEKSKEESSKEEKEIRVLRR